MSLTACGSSNVNDNKSSKRVYQQQPHYNNTARGGYSSGYYYGNAYQNQPVSRYYSNPYDIAPRNYRPYYDTDYYYVTPN